MGMEKIEGLIIKTEEVLFVLYLMFPEKSMGQEKIYLPVKKNTKKFLQFKSIPDEIT